MAPIATLIFLLPLCGFVSILLLGKYLSEKQVGVIGTGVVAGSFVLAVAEFFLLLSHASGEVTVNLFSWITVGTLHVPAAMMSDPLSITMCLLEPRVWGII